MESSTRTGELEHASIEPASFEPASFEPAGESVPEELATTEVHPSMVTAIREGCPACGAAMASDQRYCVECGERRGPARVPLKEGPAPPAAPPPAARRSPRRASSGRWRGGRRCWPLLQRHARWSAALPALHAIPLVGGHCGATGRASLADRSDHGRVDLRGRELLGYRFARRLEGGRFKARGLDARVLEFSGASARFHSCGRTGVVGCGRRNPGRGPCQTTVQLSISRGPE